MEDKCPICGNEVSIYQSNPDYAACYILDGYPEPGMGRNYCMTCVYKGILAIKEIDALKRENQQLKKQ